MKRYLKYQRRVHCYIINPGILFKNLISETNFNTKFSYHQNNLNFSELNKINDLLDFDLILVDHTGNEYSNEQILILINKLAKFNNVLTLLNFYELNYKRIPLIHLKNDWYLNETILHNDLQDNSHLIYKRIFDIIFVISTLPITLPLFLIGIILNLIFSNGPILFMQQRVGLNENLFNLYKIRTMNANHSDNAFTIENDERITKIGKFLRKSKIDELPQLYNILVGDMSLIGPRPERCDYVEEYNKLNPYYHLRHKIRPGISGWAQVNNPTATPEDNLTKLEYDLYYIKYMSLKMDLIVFFHTLKVILTFNSL
jgi:lipopolysaccharide/colanic/teichoic acid biosynthesis glycosyltransferase